MITIKECRKIFSKYNEEYKDEEIKDILELLNIFSEIDVEILKQRQDAKNSHINESSK